MSFQIQHLLWWGVILLAGWRLAGSGWHAPRSVRVDTIELVQVVYGLYGDCISTNQMPNDDLRTALLYFNVNSQYLDGLAALQIGQEKMAEKFLLEAYQRDRNPYALAVLANQWFIAGGDELFLLKVRNLDNMAHRDLSLVYLDQAAQCHLAGQSSLARRYLDLGLGLLPVGQEDAVNPRLSRRIGEIYYYAGQFLQAEPWLWRARPAGDSAVLILSRILVSQQRYVEAVPIFDQALQDYPDDMALRLQAAQVAQYAGDLAQARSFLEAVEPNERLGFGGIIELGRICSQLADFACAREQYSRVLEFDPQNQEALDFLSQNQPGNP